MVGIVAYCIGCKVDINRTRHGGLTDINKLVGTPKHLGKIALQTNMKKVPWFFIGNKNLSVIRADSVFQVRVRIRIHISFLLNTSIWNMICQSEWCRQDLIQLDLYCTRRRIVESND